MKASLFIVNCDLYVCQVWKQLYYWSAVEIRKRKDNTMQILSIR